MGKLYRVIGTYDHIIRTLLNNIILKWSSPKYCDTTLFTTNIDIKAYHTNYFINSADGQGELDYMLLYPRNIY